MRLIVTHLFFAVGILAVSYLTFRDGAHAETEMRSVYAVLKVPSLHQQLVVIRFDQMSVCERELPGLKTLLDKELRSLPKTQWDLVPPPTIDADGKFASSIEGVCRLLP